MVVRLYSDVLNLNRNTDMSVLAVQSFEGCFTVHIDGAELVDLKVCSDILKLPSEEVLASCISNEIKRMVNDLTK